MVELLVFLVLVGGLVYLTLQSYARARSQHEAERAAEAAQRMAEREAERAVEEQERERAWQAYMGLRMQLRDLVHEHLETLLLKRRQKRRRDDYGNWVEGPWSREKEYFWQTVVKEAPEGLYYDAWFGPNAFGLPDESLAIIDELMDELAAPSLAAPVIDVDGLSPEAYEGYCAEVLVSDGWDAVAGGGSGDQGVDILATKDGVKAVFQCKKYSQPVGNKAVQEALAGKAFASADLAFVVSNSSYTASAYALADAAGVYLIHHSQLEDLSDYSMGRRPE